MGSFHFTGVENGDGSLLDLIEDKVLGKGQESRAGAGAIFRYWLCFIKAHWHPRVWANGRGGGFGLYPSHCLTE